MPETRRKILIKNLDWSKIVVIFPDTVSKEFLVKAIVKNFINKEKYIRRKTKECKRRDHRIKLVEEIKRNIRPRNFKALVLV